MNYSEKLMAWVNNQVDEIRGPVDFGSIFDKAHEVDSQVTPVLFKEFGDQWCEFRFKDGSSVTYGMAEI